MLLEQGRPAICRLLTIFSSCHQARRWLLLLLPKSELRQTPFLQYEIVRPGQVKQSSASIRPVSDFTDTLQAELQLLSDVCSE